MVSVTLIWQLMMFTSLSVTWIHPKLWELIIFITMYWSNGLAPYLNQFNIYFPSASLPSEWRIHKINHPNIQIWWQILCQKLPTYLTVVLFIQGSGAHIIQQDIRLRLSSHLYTSTVQQFITFWNSSVMPSTARIMYMLLTLMLKRPLIQFLTLPD